VIRGLDRDLGELVRTEELATIKGFGPALVDKITVLVETGELPYLQGLRAKLPLSLLEWLRIPGLGPKKARAIHVNLGIATLDELEVAAREGRLRDLDGFGETTETKILEGLARVRKHRDASSSRSCAARRIDCSLRCAPVPGVIPARGRGLGATARRDREGHRHRGGGRRPQRSRRRWTRSAASMHRAS
jgi:DNA polymerase (family 10)